MGMKSEKMAICGYRCDLCALYKDNLDVAGKDEVKAAFVKYFDYEFDDNDLKACQGCPEGGDGDCKVKRCAVEKGIANCGLCDQYPCDKLHEKTNVIEKYFADISAVPKQDLELYAKPYDSKDRLDVINQNFKK